MCSVVLLCGILAGLIMKRKEISKPLERYIRILEALAAFPDGLSQAQLEQKLGLPKSTLHRLLHALEASDMVVASGGRNGVYKIGTRLLRILQSDTAWLQTVTKRSLTELAAKTGETCFIAKRFGDSVRSVAMESPDASVGIYVVPGHDLPAHATATGKLLYALDQNFKTSESLIKEFVKFTDDTIVNKKAFEEELKRIRRDQYAIERGEHVPGLATIAVPIFVNSSKLLYALGLTGPASRVMEKLNVQLRLLKSTALRLAAVMDPERPVNST